MLGRAILMGVVLACVSGAAVYYGLGEGGQTARDVKALNAASEIPAERSRESSAQAPNNSLAIAPEDTATKNAVSENSVPKSNITENKALDDKRDEIKQVEKPHQSKVKTLMKRKATASYVVGGERVEIEVEPSNVITLAPKNITPENITPETSAVKAADPEAEISEAEISETGTPNPAISNPAISNTATSEADPDPVVTRADLKDTLKLARQITNKTTRDKIYLEIFETALFDGHMDMAENLSSKLSTPELRSFAREAIATKKALSE